MAQRSLHTLQAGRGLAALAVLLFHANLTLSLPKYLGHEPAPLFRWGNSGVQFFFVLSGFVILLAHTRDLGRPRALASFAWKRFRRLYPPLWMALLLVLLLVAALPALRVDHSARTVAAAFAILPGAPESLLAPEWTLRHEVLFYAVFAVLILNRRVGLALLAAWLMASAYFLVWPLRSPTAIGDSMRSLIAPSHLLFGYGMLVCIVYQRGWLRARGAVAVATVGMALWTTAAVMRTRHPPPANSFDRHDQLFGVAAALLIAGAVVLERDHGLRVPRWLVFLGEASYAIYLVHDPIVSSMAKLTTGTLPHMHAETAFLMTSTVALAGGLIFHVACERPVLRWLSTRR